LIELIFESRLASKEGLNGQNALVKSVYASFLQMDDDGQDDRQMDFDA
jgi:hypothetical protein